MGIDKRYQFMEKMTGTKANRPQLDRLKDEVSLDVYDIEGTDYVKLEDILAIIDVLQAVMK